MSEQPAACESPTARERLLAAANQLFYEEGVNTVGIDRIIEKAGVAKASLYNTFGSKDALVRAYLQGRHEARRTRILQHIDPLPTPRAKILGIFEEMRIRAATPGFRGCAFVRASAEAREGSCIREVCAQSRAWLSDLLLTLARQAGALEPESLARQLMVLYDGAAVASQMEGDAQAAGLAREIAVRIVPA